MAGKTDYKNQYAAEKYDRIGIMVLKGGKEIIKKAAEQSGTFFRVSASSTVFQRTERSLNFGGAFVGSRISLCTTSFFLR